MPKRIKQRPMDINQAAFRMVQMSTESGEGDIKPKPPKPAKPTKSEISRVMAALGRKGGKKGGKRRLQTMTPEKRREIALKAAKARWNKKQS